jgi:penicillin-binding protein 2
MLQLAQATAVLANNGIKHKPRLVIGTQDPVTRVMTPLPLAPAEDLGYKPQNVAVIRKALVGVAQGGTSAKVFAGAGYVSGGKTGTAQAVAMAQKGKYNSAKLEEHQRDHALYIALAPADNPQIAIAVIVENAGWGAGAAAPIARRAFDYLLLGQYPSEEDMAAVQKGAAGAPIGKPRLAADMVGALVPGAATEASASPLLRVAAAAPAASAAAAPLKVAVAKAGKAAKAIKKAKTVEEAGEPAAPSATRITHPN